MSNSEDRRKGSELLNRIYDALEETLLENVSASRDFLIQEGADPDKLVSEGLALIKRLSARQRLAQRRLQLDRVRNTLYKMKEEGAESLENVRAHLAEAFAGKDNSWLVQVYHHKLQSVPEDDLRSLGDDEALIALWELLEREDE